MTATARTLYEIRDDLDALAELLFEVGGDISEADAEAAIDAWLTETHEARNTKLDRYAALIREIETRGEARRTEAARLLERASADDGAVKRLKARLLWFLQDQQLTKVETPRFRLTVANNGGATPVRLLTEPAALPEPYREQIVTYRARTDLIREELAAGASLPFAELGERGQHLRIR